MHLDAETVQRRSHVPEMLQQQDGVVRLGSGPMYPVLLPTGQERSGRKLSLPACAGGVAWKVEFEMQGVGRSKLTNRGLQNAHVVE